MKKPKTYGEMLEMIGRGVVWGKTYSPASGQAWVKYPYFRESLYLIPNNGAGRPCIGWHHFGSSANSYSVSGLRFIITVIFETTFKQFIKDHEMIQR